MAMMALWAMAMTRLQTFEGMRIMSQVQHLIFSKNACEHAFFVCSSTQHLKSDFDIIVGT